MGMYEKMLKTEKRYAPNFRASKYMKEKKGERRKTRTRKRPAEICSTDF